MARRGESAARYIDQESGGGPDPNSRHAGQDRMKRVRKYQALYFSSDFIALAAQCRQLLRQARQDDACGLRS